MFATTGRFQLLASVAALLLAASGCTSLHDYVHNGFKVGPNYARPAAPVAPDWIDADDTISRAEPEQLACWWRVFGDPTLDALIVNASQQNLTLREAGCRVLQARAARAIAGGYLFPQQQQMVGDYQRNALSLSSLNTPFLPARYSDQWNVGFNLAWELDFWGRFRRAIEAADADLDASVEAYDEVLVTLLGDVATTYVEIRTLQQRIELAQFNIQLQRETFNIADARYRGGQVSELDVDQAASTLAQTEATVPQLELQLRIASNVMCILLGVPPYELEAALGRGIIPVTPKEIAVGIPADLLRRRPDVRRAERQVAAESARVGVATSELYPHIAITGTVALSSREFSDLFRGESMTGSIGPGFQWNVLNYGRLLNAIRAQDAQLAELIVAYQNSVLKANAEVENGLTRFLRAQQRAHFLGASVDAAEKAARVAITQYRAGLTDFNRVSLVEQNLVQQQDLYTQSQGEIALGLVEVYRALGGGWQIRLQPAPGPVAIPPGQSTTPPPTLEVLPRPDEHLPSESPLMAPGTSLPTMPGANLPEPTTPTPAAAPAY